MDTYEGAQLEWMYFWSSLASDGWPDTGMTPVHNQRPGFTIWTFLRGWPLLLQRFMRAS